MTNPKGKLYNVTLLLKNNNVTEYKFHRITIPTFEALFYKNRYQQLMYTCLRKQHRKPASGLSDITCQPECPNSKPNKCLLKINEH